MHASTGVGTHIVKQVRVNTRSLAGGFQALNRWLRVLSWNVNGVRARLKDGSFSHSIKHCDVLCITEFRCSRGVFLRKKGVRQMLNEEGFKFWSVHTTATNKGYAGVCVISKNPFSFSEQGVGEWDLDVEGRVVTAHFDFFALVVAYFPNSGRKRELSSAGKRMRFDRALRLKLSELDRPFILVGDFNVIEKDSDAQGGLCDPHWHEHPGCSPLERDGFVLLKKENDLVDLQEHEGKQAFTFSCTCSARQVWRCKLDYVLVSECLVSKGLVKDFSLQTHVATSDHLPQAFLVNAGLFENTRVPHLPLAEVAEIHEQACGLFSAPAAAVLNEMDEAQVGSVFFYIDERVAAFSEEEGGAGVALEKYVLNNSAFVRKWDPAGTGVVSCEQINSLFGRGKGGQKMVRPNLRGVSQ